MVKNTQTKEIYRKQDIHVIIYMNEEKTRVRRHSCFIYFRILISFLLLERIANANKKFFSKETWRYSITAQDTTANKTIEPQVEKLYCRYIVYNCPLL